MKEIKFGLAGCGGRGRGLTRDILCKLEGVTVAAVCDPYLDKAETAAKEVLEKKGYEPKVYTDHKKMLDEAGLDAVLVATAWEYHAEVAIDAMERHIAVALEVGGAYNEEECKKLVETYEKTKTPVMLMENCCFNRDELLATNLARKDSSATSFTATARIATICVTKFLTAISTGTIACATTRAETAKIIPRTNSAP